MKIKQIFLDVDDTLVDFTLAALEFVGVDLKHVDLDSFYERFGYNIVKAANELRSLFTVAKSTSDFWNSIPRSFWASLQKTPECDSLIRGSCDLVGRENVFLLTTPIDDPECGAGKMELIRDVFPDFWEDRRYLIGPPKYACAHGGALLIDDSDKNVNLFRKHHGIAALLPRPWNSLHKLRGLKGVMLPEVR